MSNIIFHFPDQALLAQNIAKKIDLKLGDVIFRHFPDNESYVRILSDVHDKNVILVCSLNQPDEKFLPLIFFVETVRQLGAKKVGLLAPYLSYMRQDKSFQLGEAVNSKIFASLVSKHFDWLITIDPHLHRHKDLNEIYSIPACSLHTASLIAEWIKTNISNPILIGPDEESAQWVATVANLADSPYIVLKKIRRGDRDVEISIPDVEKFQNKTPVLVDDIISTAKTMIETVRRLERAKMNPTVCIGVHAIFVNGSFQELLNENVAQVITCNTIVHESNKIDVSDVIVDKLQELLQ